MDDEIPRLEYNQNNLFFETVADAGFKRGLNIFVRYYPLFLFCRTLAIFFNNTDMTFEALFIVRLVY
jgi:hypothetical protein